MATVARRLLGPTDHGKTMSLKTFTGCSFEEGWLYELARGVVDVTEVPAPSVHGRIVWRVRMLIDRYHDAHPGLITYAAGGGECRLRLPGMQSDRHPDQAVYLDPEPPGKKPWTRWCPHLVVEVVSKGGEHRDSVEKREEYLRLGVREYWILDPAIPRMLVLTREGDTWKETKIPAGKTYRCAVLPGLETAPEELFGAD